MATAAFYLCIFVILVHHFVAILAQFMCCLLIAVDIRITNVLGMTVGTFINHHYLILGMMAGSTGI